MGKINQLGTLEEVLAMCQVDKRMIPCVDFGHLNARTLGNVNDTAAFEAVLNAMEDALKDERAIDVAVVGGRGLDHGGQRFDVPGGDGGAHG